MLIDENSLATTIDNVNEALFRERPIDNEEKKAVSAWIADRFGKPRSYRGLFAPTDDDYKNGIRLFTGEKITSGAGTAHILSEEAGRVLLLLGSDINEKVRDTLLSMLSERDTPQHPWGQWCCGTCTASLWRHFAAGGGNRQEERMINGLKDITRCRNENGRWKRYPFYYTILALTEMDIAPARDELRFAGNAMERAFARLREQSEYEVRKKELLARALDRI